MVSYELLFQGFPGWSPTHGRLAWPSLPLIKAGGKNILFDTGHYGVHKLLLQKLADRGLNPSDIDLLVISHGHWDHSLGFPLFPRAEVVIGERELEWALKVNPAENTTVPLYVMEHIADCPRLRTLKGDTELMPGITMIDTPGHTPGHMSMVLETAEGCVVLAQDAVKNRAEFLARQADQTLDAAATSASIERVAAVANVVIPGHDRAFRVEQGRVTYTEELRVEILARISASMDEEAVFTICLK
jgi:N-acyl homoserine lactone hydrolase